MKFLSKINVYIRFSLILVMVLAVKSCESKKLDNQNLGSQDHPRDYPAFITPVEEYFDVRLGSAPAIDGDSYRLKVTGAIDNPATFSLSSPNTVVFITY